jgi:trimeric autotransporter adhesin
MGFSYVTRGLLVCTAAVVLASCGGKSSSSTSATPASIRVNPTSFSLNHGDVVSFSTTPQVLDSTGTALTTQPTFIYSSSNPSVVSVTASGQVCAGVFDANNIVCQVQPDIGAVPTANIIVSGDGLTTTVPVFVHPRVDKITISGPVSPPLCLSQNQTEQFSAKAFSTINGTETDVTAQVGSFVWSTGNAALATVDTNGIVTSRQPGATTVIASITNTTGTPAIVIDCPPKTISLAVSGGTSITFNVATGTSQTLTPTVTDILGQPIANATLTYSSYVPSAGTISTGTVATPGAGTTSFVASCSPPGCNPAIGNTNANATGVGLPIYSNPVVGTITGSTVTTVYVTGADNPSGSANTSLIPITISSNTAGTAVTLQGSPNSMVFNRAGTTAYIGSTAGMLIFDAASNTVTATAAGLTGTVLSVSNDGSTVIISDVPNGKVFVYNASSNSSQEFDVPGVTAADFDADNTKAYLTAGSKVYEFSPATATFKPLTFAADGVVFTPQESVAYFGGSSILGIAVCNDTRVDNATGAANILRATPDGTHMIGAGAGGWVDLTYTVNNSPPNATTGCPPLASNTANVSAGFGSASTFVGTPTQIAVTSNDSFAFLTSYTGGSAANGIPFYQFASGANPATTGAIALNGAGTLFSGSITQDGTSLYVGVGNVVHRIDLTKSPPVDSNQITVTFNPRIVVVRPQ